MAKEAPIIIYALNGSQFVAKVLAALNARNIEHYVQPVSFDVNKRALPSGGRLVPELQVGTGAGKVIVSDSEKILHWFDDNRGSKFFPNDQASELSVRASDKTLAASVWYYNWVNFEGYSKTMRKSVRKFLPWFIPMFLGDLFVSSTRTQMRNNVKKALDLTDDDLADEPAMRQRLVAELKFYQNLLKDDSQNFLLPGDEPTAVDFSVLAQVERLVGGDFADIYIAPALAELKEDESLQRLWKWHQTIRNATSIQFQNKKPPADLLGDS